MKIFCEISLKKFEVDLSSPIDLSIPLLFGGRQPNFFDVSPASSRPLLAGDFTGDTRQGGSCNVEEYRLIAHCNGTHTECVGHIVNQQVAINEILRDALLPATLITVLPQAAGKTPETYHPPLESNDRLITAKDLSNALTGFNRDFLTALIIRTLPNNAEKELRNYSQKPAPFFTIEAMEFIADCGVQHLLVDIPSVDRANDEGRMTVHHIFWNIAQGSHELKNGRLSLKTITEMIYAPDEVADGLCLINIQIPPFVTDAAPSRPLLYKIIEKDEKDEKEQ
ncbi:MAG: cyclase family protein [Calditrichia bacterium]